jgi:hypothetical protein
LFILINLKLFNPISMYMNMQILMKTVFISFFALLFQFAYSQANKVMLLDTYKDLSPKLTPYLQKGREVIFKKESAASLLITKPTTINFSFLFENREWEIVLEKSDLFSEGFKVTTGSGANENYNYKDNALHYRGFIKGKPHSFAAISILPDQLVGVITDENGNINIGAINTTAAKRTNEHIIYRDADFLLSRNFNCAVADETNQVENPIPVYNPSSLTSTTINSEPLDIYFEADYSIYQNNGSNITNVVNYVTSLFNVVHTLYENDSINTKISGIKVWNTIDPYRSLTTSSNVLSAFSTSMTNGFQGDIAHFLSQRSLGGGVAYRDILCSSNRFKTGVNGNLSNSFNLFPAYSWSTMVITHEIGHNIGSSHTHSCSWPGGAIDNCATTEGGCAAGPAPTNGGTIMSYCHLKSYGINFANGFGPLPGALIRNRVRNNSCLNPGVYFETTTQSVTEENADIVNGCLDYKLLTASIKIPYAATQPVDVTLVPTGNTGLLIGTNQDVEITPTSFTLDSANLSKTIQFKVYNDALVENTETLTMNFNLNSNGGNAVKRNVNNTHIINIISMDHKPDSFANQLVYYEPFDTITGGLGNWSQTIVYGLASPNRWIIGNSGDAAFSTKAAYISNNASTNTYSGATIQDSSILRLESPTIDAIGFRNLSLGYQYKCNGEVSYNSGGGGSGQVVGKDFGKLYYSIDNGGSWTQLKTNIAERNSKQTENISLPADANNSSTLKIAFEWINNASIVNNSPFIIDSIVIKGATVTPVQTLAHPANTVEEYVGPNQTVHFYNPITQNLLATIENSSAVDFGCVSVGLTRTGTGANNGWDSTEEAKISDKAFTITASNNNISAPYKLTLYLTKEEADGWLSATGNSKSDIRIVKTSGDISQYPISTPPIFSTSNSISNFGTAPNLAISGLFTGFSSFALMKPFMPAKCPASNITLVADLTGTSYQWQVNTGIGYTNINNSASYTGVNTDSLLLTAAPSGWYGYKYRCAVTTNEGLVYSPVITLKFGMVWQGTLNNAWENPSNWGCGILPDENVDVIVNTGTNFSPRVSTNASIRSLKISPAAAVEIDSGINLTIKH